MYTEKVPVEIFVAQVLSTKAARQIYDDWPLKPEVIANVVTRHLRDLSIFHITPAGQDTLIRQEILYYLKNSAILVEMIEKARQAAADVAERSRPEDA